MSSLRAQFEEMNENALTIPNAMSLLRIILIPFFVFFFLDGSYLVAVIIIAVSGFSDLFDGKIARHFNQISKLGKLLDPAADKLTQVALSLVLFSHFYSSDDKALHYFSFVFLFFCLKELVMIIGSFFLLSINIVPQAAIMYGKVATFAYYAAMGLLLCFAPKFGAFSKFFTLPDIVIIIMVSASAIMTLVAFLAYLPDTIKQMKARKDKTEENTSEEG